MNKPKSKRQGYVVYRRDRKKWETRYFEYDTKKGGDRARSKLFDTREEAKEFLATIMYQKENPLYIKYNGIPFCEMMRANLEQKKDSNQINEATYGRALRTIESIEKHPIGRKRIDEITSEEIQDFMNEHMYLSNSTIKKLYQMIGTTFTIALNRGYIRRNPMINVLRPKSNKEDKEVRAFTIEEQQKFTEYILSKDLRTCRYKTVFLLQMYMGLRVGEVLALTSDDIDLKGRQMIIHRTLTRSASGAVMMGNTTKTYAGRRVLPIPKYLYPFIVEQMKVAESKSRNTEKLLFKADHSKYVNRGNVNSELHRILKKEFGITDISTHSLRHTYGTRCIESGMQAVVVQKLMGHKDIATTLNIYTSVLDKFKEQEIEKVNQYYLKEKMLFRSNLLNTFQDSEV